MVPGRTYEVKQCPVCKDQHARDGGVSHIITDVEPGLNQHHHKHSQMMWVVNRRVVLVPFRTKRTFSKFRGRHVILRHILENLWKAAGRHCWDTKSLPDVWKGGGGSGKVTNTKLKQCPETEWSHPLRCIVQSKIKNTFHHSELHWGQN